MKNAKSILIKILVGIFTIILIAVLIIWIKSPGTTAPILDSNGNKIAGSIATIEKLNIGNLDQYLIIRGADSTKPVLLFLHGGPGSPEFPFLQNKKLNLENEFVMVHWEQRGAGKSYSENIPSESMTLDQMVADIKEITNYLQKRFQKEKIYLVGHSWGTVLGATAAFRHSELFHAYVGIGQAGNQYLGEQTSFEWVKTQAQERNDKKAIAELARLTFPTATASSQEWLDYLNVERKYVNAFGGGLSRQPVDVFKTFAKLIINAPEYTIKEKLHYEKANYYSMHHLWSVIMTENLNETIGRMELPVYILEGRYDYQTPHAMAKAFFDQLDAKEKKFFTFEQSAHVPFFNEPDKFNEIMVNEVLKK